MKYLNFRTIIFGFVIFVLSGCQTYETESIDGYKSRGETQEESYVDYYSSFRNEFSEEVEKDGKKIYVTKYSVLKLEDLERKLESSIAIIDQITDYKNQEDASFIDEFKLRKELENDRKILEAQLQRVKLARLHETFRGFTGTSFHGASNENGKYDAKRIFWPKDLESAFPFTFDKIEDARERKILEEIEHNIDTSKRKLDKKEPDPLQLDDPNAFVWKSKDEAIEIISYKISNSEKHENSQSDYIEGFRIPDGKKEKSPALKIFFPQGDSNGVIVLDTDKENEVGFGIPDIVETVSISKIADIWNIGSIIPRLFTDKEKRVVPKKPDLKPIGVEIARIGNPIDIWENSKDQNGWLVPFNYKNDIGSNYKIRLKLEDVKSEMILNRHVEYIAKDWTGASSSTPSVGAVAEYFKPKPPFNENNLSSAEVKNSENPKMVSFVFENGTIETGIVTHVSNKFIEDYPYAIEYTEGQKRWRIEKDAGSSVFNKKKEVALK